MQTTSFCLVEFLFLLFAVFVSFRSQCFLLLIMSLFPFVVSWPLHSHTQREHTQNTNADILTCFTFRGCHSQTKARSKSCNDPQTHPSPSHTHTPPHPAPPSVRLFQYNRLLPLSIPTTPFVTHIQRIRIQNGNISMSYLHVHIHSLTGGMEKKRERDAERDVLIRTPCGCASSCFPCQQQKKTGGWVGVREGGGGRGRVLKKDDG